MDERKQSLTLRRLTALCAHLVIMNTWYGSHMSAFFGFYRLYPRDQLLELPVLLVHDVVIEQVGDDVLDSHAAAYPDAPTVAGTVDALEYPISPDAFHAEGSPFCVVNGMNHGVEGAAARDGGHAERTALLCFKEDLTAGPGSHDCAA